MIHNNRHFSPIGNQCILGHVSELGSCVMGEPTSAVPKQDICVLLRQLPPRFLNQGLLSSTSPGSVRFNDCYMTWGCKLGYATGLKTPPVEKAKINSQGYQTLHHNATGNATKNTTEPLPLSYEFVNPSPPLSMCESHGTHVAKLVTLALEFG